MSIASLRSGDMAVLGKGYVYMYLVKKHNRLHRDVYFKIITFIILVLGSSDLPTAGAQRDPHHPLTMATKSNVEPKSCCV